MSFERGSSNNTPKSETPRMSREQYIGILIRGLAQDFFPEIRYPGMQEAVTDIRLVDQQEFEQLRQEAQDIEDDPNSYSHKQIAWRYEALPQANIQVLMRAIDGEKVTAVIVYSDIAPTNLPE
jgi:hypothetical protein